MTLIRTEDDNDTAILPAAANTLDLGPAGPDRAPDAPRRFLRQPFGDSGRHAGGLVRPDQLSLAERSAHLLAVGHLTAVCENRPVDSRSCRLFRIAGEVGFDLVAAGDQHVVGVQIVRQRRLRRVV